MSGHTKGPWEIVFCDEDQTSYTTGEKLLREEGASPADVMVHAVGMASYLKNPGHYRDIHCWTSAHEVLPGDADHAEHLANARLMAAAPELLAAAEAIRTALVWNAAPIDVEFALTQVEEVKLKPAVLLDLLAAIAKARGGK